MAEELIFSPDELLNQRITENVLDQLVDRGLINPIPFRVQPNDSVSQSSVFLKRDKDTVASIDALLEQGNTLERAISIFTSNEEETSNDLMATNQEINNLLDSFTHRQLKAMARDLRIRNFSRMNALELAICISDEERRVQIVELVRQRSAESRNTEVTEPVAEEVTESVAEEVTEPVVEEVAEPVVEEVTESVAEEVTEPVVEEVTESVAEEVTEPVVEEVAEPVVEEVAEPVTEEVAEPVVEEVAEPVTEEVAEPVVEISNNVMEIINQLDYPEIGDLIINEYSSNGSLVGHILPNPASLALYALNDMVIDRIISNNHLIDNINMPKWFKVLLISSEESVKRLIIDRFVETTTLSDETVDTISSLNDEIDDLEVAQDTNVEIQADTTTETTELPERDLQLEQTQLANSRRRYANAPERVREIQTLLETHLTATPNVITVYREYSDQRMSQIAQEQNILNFRRMSKWEKAVCIAEPERREVIYSLVRERTSIMYNSNR